MTTWMPAPGTTASTGRWRRPHVPRHGQRRRRRRPGDDTFWGQSGNDRISGGAGDDTMNGSKGKDRYSGGPGNDFIISIDGVREIVDCGRGYDRVYADKNDRLRGCERRI